MPTTHPANRDDHAGSLRVLITGGSGVLGRAVAPLLHADGHQLHTPTRTELDLFDPSQVADAVTDVQAVLHLATRIPPRDRQADPNAWRENDKLRRDTTRLLVEAALVSGVERVIFPSIAFVYPAAGRVSEATAPGDPGAPNLHSALDAEHEVSRFTTAGGSGVVLRLGLLYGPGTGSDAPAERYRSFGATLRVQDAAQALRVALSVPSGIYNVVNDGERISNDRFKQVTGWTPGNDPITTRECP